MGVFSSFFSDYKKVSGAGRYAGEFDAWQPIILRNQRRTSRGRAARRASHPRGGSFTG